MNKNDYIVSILLNSKGIKKEFKEIELINKLCFDIYEKGLEKNTFFFRKIKQISNFVGLDLFSIKNLKYFFLNYKDKNLIDKFKNTIIICNIDEYLKIYKQFPYLDSIYIKKLKLINYFLENVPETKENNFKLKLFLVEKNNLEIDYVLELLKLKKKIYEKSIKNNGKNILNIKMQLNSKKIKFIRKLEKFDE